jgi:hypothetical protein
MNPWANLLIVLNGTPQRSENASLSETLIFFSAVRAGSTSNSSIRQSFHKWYGLASGRPG